MRRIPFLILCLCFIFATVVSAQSSGTRKGEARRVSKKKPRPDFTCGLPLSVTALNLSHIDISSSCPEPAGKCSPNPKIEIAVTAMQPEGATIEYVYSITAGKISGSGANVIWDLSFVPPGEYTITAGIDMGKPWGVVGQIQTRRVRVLDCTNCRSETVDTPDTK